MNREPILLISSQVGVYVPQVWVNNREVAGFTRKSSVSEDDIKILYAGPDEEFYWDAFDNAVNNTDYEKDGVAWRMIDYDGDLWLVHPQDARFGFENHGIDAEEIWRHNIPCELAECLLTTDPYKRKVPGPSDLDGFVRVVERYGYHGHTMSVEDWHRWKGKPDPVGWPGESETECIEIYFYR